jgi:colicin import membrane protein
VIARTTLPGPLRRLLWASLSAHAALFVALLVASQTWALGRRPPQTVLMTKLVRLGTKRPPDLLPRLTAPAPRPGPIAIPPSPSAARPASAHAPPPAVSARERTAEMNQVSRALERIKKDVTAAGDPSGTPDGEVSDLAHAVAGNAYATEIYKCLKANWDILGLERAQVAGRAATVWMSIEADGHFVDWRIEKGSGLDRFDQAVLRAVRKCNQVSPPPRQLLEQVRQDGVVIDFTL